MPGVVFAKGCEFLLVGDGGGQFSCGRGGEELASQCALANYPLVSPRFTQSAM